MKKSRTTTPRSATSGLSKGLRLIAAGSVASLALSSGALAERGSDERRQPPRPPEVALDACSNADKADPCSFEGRRGKALNGICEDIRGELACVPEGHRRGRHGERGDEDGPS